MPRSPDLFDRRSSGLLLHPTSLPGPYGCGDCGPEAAAFIDFLADAGQTWWQMLPLNPPDGTSSFSPYNASSAFGGSPWLISPARLVDEGLLQRSDLRGLPAGDRAEPARLVPLRLRLLRRAHRAFASLSRGPLRRAYDAFVATHAGWLDDDALFAALRRACGGRAWQRWPSDLRLRRPDALAAARERLASEIDFHRFAQFLVDRQWTALRRHARARGVRLLGDVPIFVALDSADVWARRALFLLDPDGRARAVSGYPPDDFARNGQLWGHPQYDWDAHRREGFAWWIDRFRRTFDQFDAVRIDHFLGFHRAWHVPGRARTARGGRWRPGPGADLFHALEKALGRRAIVAEDLGRLTPEAAALRDRFDLPGMRVVQFGFGDGASYHLPFRHPVRSVAYTGTHDNQTIVGWWRSAPADQRRRAAALTGLRGGDDVHWAFLRHVMGGPANTVVFPVQDVLGLDDRGRMNVPGTARGNWRWRLRPGELTPRHARRLRELTALFERLPVG